MLQGGGLSPPPQPQFSPGGAEAGQTQRIGVVPKKVLQAAPSPGDTWTYCSTRLLLPSPASESSVMEWGHLSESQHFPAQGGHHSKDTPFPGSTRKTF